MAVEALEISARVAHRADERDRRLPGLTVQVVERAYAERRVSLTAPAVPPSNDGARRLGEAYWEAVAAFSRGLVRPHRTADGVELALLRIVPLLRFSSARTEVSTHGVECRFPIRGGLLASGPGGALVLRQRAAGGRIELSLAVHGFQPRLARDGRLGIRRRLFRALQAPLHEGVSRRFLERATRGKL